MNAICPLCSTLSKEFYVDKNTYYRCQACYGIFADEDDKPSVKSEKQRYELHNDDVNDIGYRKFVSPITHSILNNFSIHNSGLDFGAGTSAIISAILKEKNYNILNYDPYFHAFPELLERKYDYISSCEVIEHFYNPHKEFSLLKKMLNTDAKMYLMTEPYNEGINFASWYYKNDPTHVFFYTKETFQWIKKEFGFSNVIISKRLIVFEN